MSERLSELINYLAQFVTAQKWEKIQRVAASRTRHLTVVLEHLNQPLNMSAALRSVEALGIQDVSVVDSPEFKSELNPGVAKGAQDWLTLSRYRGIEGQVIHQCLADLRAKGYKIIATMPHAQGQSPELLDVSSKTAIVFGNEEFGVSRAVQEVADGFLTIPMCGFTESFNVAATVAICIHTLTERLKASSVNWQLSSDEIAELCCQWLKKNVRSGDEVERMFYQKIREQ
jgi:tRNA (guanosine-2'-O-)-methyltransferase